MPWKASFRADLLHPDPRLDGYRDRAAMVMDGDAVVLTFYVQPDFRATHEGGKLWWRRWSAPTEFLILLGEGESGNLDLDEWLIGDQLTDELANWAADRFRFRGREFRLVWLDDERSAVTRDEWQLTSPTRRRNRAGSASPQSGQAD